MKTTGHSRPAGSEATAASYPRPEYTRHHAYFARHAPPTPCLLMDLDVVAEKYRALSAALPGARVYFAVKACAEPELLRLLADLGCGFDVASPGEMDLCLKAGAQPEDLSYGHTVKKPTDIVYARQRGVRLFALDSPEELAKLATFAPGCDVSCRITVDTDGAQWPISRKFGCSADEAIELMIQASSMGLHPRAITFHVGSQQLIPARWAEAIGRASTVIQALAAESIEISVLNLGGGLPANYGPDVPEVERYCEVILAALREHGLAGGSGTPNNVMPRPPMLIVEPGRYLPADAGMIRSEVVLVTHRSEPVDRRWVYVDIGRFGGLAETEGEAIVFPLVTTRNGRSFGTASGPAVVAGPTCDSADTLYEHNQRTLPLDLAIGDYVDFLGTGAYTIPYCSVGFNGFPPLVAHCFSGPI